MKAVLFDLDGTLLPMDQEVFTRSYFGALTGFLAPHGYDPEKLIKSMWAGTEQMVLNDGGRTNEEAFWDKFAEIWGEKGRADKALFDRFYAEFFDDIRQSCGYNPLVPETVALLKEKGLRLIVATNPIFPYEANRQRIEWAGVSPDDFEYISSYDNSTYCKPNPKYFSEIAKKRGLSESDCLMVGNDTGEDMTAAKTGMSVFLLTDCVINKKNIDISAYSHGGFAELNDYIQKNI